MSTELYKGQSRVRCDVCKRLVAKKRKPFKIKDAIYEIEIDCCCQNCRDNYWMHHYQPHLPITGFNHWFDPYGNTGVLFGQEDKT